MKRILLLLSTLLVAASAFGQGLIPSRFGSTYNSQTYTQWSVPIFLGNSATGSASIILAAGSVTLPDGRVIIPFSTTAPLQINDGANSEVVTPSSVSNCTFGNVANVCTITATFVNTHGGSAATTVSSGSQGIQEAILDATNNGGGMVYWKIDPGIVTLSTGAANTNLGTVSIPTRSIVMAATAKVTTTIATCAGGWSLGYTSGTEFTAANTTLTAGTTTDSSTMTLPAIMTGAAIVPIAHCTTSNASAGALHAHFEGYKLVAPAN